MDVHKIKEFLAITSGDLDNLIFNAIDKKIKEAAVVGTIPVDLLKHFSQLSKGGKRIRGSLVKLGYLIGEGLDENEILKQKRIYF